MSSTRTRCATTWSPGSTSTWVPRANRLSGMHGEFKVPGGKLVVVDLEVVDDRIANFRLAGDFFLEPDEALPAIDAAVTGLPAASDARTITAAVQAALPDGAQLLGFAPDSVATAVRRALQSATSWRDYDWQLVHPGPLTPLMH